LLSDQQLKTIIADLKAMEQRCLTSRQRYAFYAYLSAVFAFYTSLKRNNKAKSSAHRIAGLFGIRTQKRAHPIRIIIDATSAADEKAKSRWSRALRYAWHERRRWKSIREFWRENQGPAGAAARWAALHPRTPPSYVRIGGEGGVPRVPSFPDADLMCSEQLYVRNGKVFRRRDAM
jgi:hypothetical protein